jgi:hypothetical protein
MYIGQQTAEAKVQQPARAFNDQQIRGQQGRRPDRPASGVHQLQLHGKNLAP